MRCSDAALASDEPLAGSAPRADIWVVVEHPAGWGDADLTRTAHGVRVLMARASREATPAGGSGVRVWVAHCADPEPIMRLGWVDDPAEIAGWDLAAVARGSHRAWGEPDPDPLLLVCANGRRDRCCGHSGGRLADTLWAGAHTARILTSTHLGGHRFAPTALLLPWGVLHGRLDAADATAVLEQAALGLTPTRSLRGHSTRSEAAQVAERNAREVCGYDRLAPLDVSFEGASHAAEPAAILTARVTLPDGSLHLVDLVSTTAPVLASCGRTPESTTRWTPA